MKIRTRFLFLLALAFTSLSTAVHAQKKLTSSSTAGHYTRIYKLSDVEAYHVALNSTSVVSDRYFHTLVDSFAYAKSDYTKKLPYGNYIYVTAIGNKLDYVLKPVANVNLDLLNNGDGFQCIITDLRGNLISDAEVKIGKSKTVGYQSAIRSYRTGIPRNESVITVKYKGFSNFFKYSAIKNNRNQKISWWRRIFHPEKRNRNAYRPDPIIADRYKGYMVFNKPKYRPLDTVKFKAYLVDQKGRAISNKTLKAELYRGGFNPDADGIALGTVLPYHEGGYAYSFVLADSMKLTLDDTYIVVLKEEVNQKWLKAFTGNFTYEDYELKALNFNVRMDKDVYRPGNPATIFMKAVDENELAVPDGRVEVNVRSNYVERYRNDRVFVQDSLWNSTIALDPSGETKLVLPDSIFTKADLDFSVSFVLRNSNNEQRSAYLSAKYLYTDQQIKTRFKKDSLFADYRVDDRSVPTKAMLYTRYDNSGELDSAQVELPLALKVDFQVREYSFRTAGGLLRSVFVSELDPGISVAAGHGKDSLRIMVRNERHIPFWYTVYSGQSLLFKGYATSLDTLLKHNSAKITEVVLSYLWGAEQRNIRTSAFYSPEHLNVTLLTPEIVYPGQTVKMQVKVSDMDNRPVPATDVTVYAATSKFSNSAVANLPRFGKGLKWRIEKPLGSAKSLTDESGSLRLNWEKWGKALGLDTIAYYQFVQAKDLFEITESSADTMAVIAPFVVNDGQIEPVHILYIDEVPVFMSQAEHLQRYAFRVKPGNHQIRMRTATNMVLLENQTYVKGKKTILSVAANVSNPKASVSVVPDTLSNQESAMLNKYMIRIQDNFAGRKTVLQVNEEQALLNPPPLVNRGKELIIGPLNENYFFFNSGQVQQTFLKEPGYTYTFLPDLLKQKSFGNKYAFNTHLSLGSREINTNYKQYPLQKGEIDSLWNEYLDLRSRTTPLLEDNYGSTRGMGRLLMVLDTAVANKMPYLKNIILYKSSMPDYVNVYPGQYNYPKYVEADGQYSALYLFKDNRYFVVNDIQVKKNGINYYQWKGVEINPADSMSISIDQLIKSVRQRPVFENNAVIKERIVSRINERYFDAKRLTNKVSGVVMVAEKGTPVAGAMVRVRGLQIVAYTDKQGKYMLKAPPSGKLVFSAKGFEDFVVDLSNHDPGKVYLEIVSPKLNEVVIRGYQKRSREATTGSSFIVSGKEVHDVPVSNVEQLLQGKVAGLNIQNNTGAPGLRGSVNIRGLSTNADKKPLIMVDGLPFTGGIDDVKNIDNIEILKDADATALYGTLGANGVILIKTKGGNTRQDAAGELVASGQTLRTKFSDYAIWQPKLLTDQEGRASFNAVFPDDITSWVAKVVAMNGRKQGGTTQTTIKSFKVLSANFVAPQFALTGDSISVLGKLMNYSNTSERVSRRFSYNGTELLNSAVQFKNAHLDTVRIVAAGSTGSLADSLSFEYTMKQANGYFDGEIRKIPVLPTGVLETKGYFDAFLRDTTITYRFDASLGKVTLRAEASVFPTLLDEIEKLRRYEYLCNEQLASKLKALLLEKKVRNYLNEAFKEEKNIKEIIKKLQNSRRPEGTWGWWQDSGEEMWISLHVVDALLQAEKQGYAVEVDKNRLYNYLVGKLGGNKNIDQVYAVKLLHLLNNKHYLNDWVEVIEKQRDEVKKKSEQEHKLNPNYPVDEPSLYEQLQVLQLRQLAGMPTDLSAMMGKKKSTMFGSSYWGDYNRRFWDNSIQNTLLAYQILKAQGGYPAELGKIVRYFLEQRKDGQWRNTYESSLILETILPELMVAGKKPEPAALVLNQTETITAFPYSKVVESAQISVAKKGDAPVYFTAYQQFINPKPEKKGADFRVSTSFEQKGLAVTRLKAGVSTSLKVEVEVRADADYVMIEIPIPAGCSYENKTQSYWGAETHREYFKHKTSIFCTKLKQGKYTFTVQLMPRYSGVYNLNPAKAEMMYFPVFYGREGMKKITIN